MPMSLSTATPERLPGIENLRRLTKSISMLDAMICPEWECRYFSCNSQWGQGEEMASMWNCCGDDWFLLFDSHGAALKGVAHECPLAGDASFAIRIQQSVPSVFASFLREPAFSMEMASFCIWRRHSDSVWSVVSPAGETASPDKDGSADLLGILDGKPETYQSWATSYYEREIDPDAVRAIYQYHPLSDRLLAALNAELALSDVTKDAIEIGYSYESNT